MHDDRMLGKDSSPRTLPLPLTIAAVIVSFVLGYLLRPTSDSLAGTTADDTTTPHKRTSSRTERSDDPRTKTPRSTTKTTATASDFDKAPTDPAGFRHWFLEQVNKDRWKDDPSVYFQMVQQYAVMDEAGISDVVQTFQQFVREWKDEQTPEISKVPKEWLTKLGITPALFRYAQLNPQAALEVIGSDPSMKSEEAYQVALANLTSQSPEQALNHVSHLQGEDLRMGLEPILGTLISTDPERVIQLLDAHPQPELDRERRKVAERLAATDPMRAIEFATTTVQAGHDPDVLKSAVKTWMKSDRNAALRWVESYAGPGSNDLKPLMER